MQNDLPIENRFRPTKLNINLRGADGLTLLIIACKNGYESLLDLLLTRQDLDVNLPCQEFGRTPLMWLVEFERPMMLHMLLASPKHHVLPNLRDNEGRTALFMALLSQNEETVGALLRLPYLDVNQMSGYQYPAAPLHHVVIEVGDPKFRHEILKQLLAHPEIDPNMPCGANEEVPLVLAQRNRWKDIFLELLLHPGTDVNRRDRNGVPPFAYAISDHDPQYLIMLSCHPKFDFNPLYPGRTDTIFVNQILQTPLTTLRELLEDPRVICGTEAFEKIIFIRAPMHLKMWVASGRALPLKDTTLGALTPQGRRRERALFRSKYD